MNIEHEVDLNIDYEKRLAKFKKYQKDGVDIAFRCYSCGKIVLQTDILYGICCRRCGRRKVYPITADLTWFGLMWCLFWNWYYDKIRQYKRTVELL